MKCDKEEDNHDVILYMFYYTKISRYHIRSWQFYIYNFFKFTFKHDSLDKDKIKKSVTIYASHLSDLSVMIREIHNINDWDVNKHVRSTNDLWMK